jgi:hypothetical protein
MQWLLPSGPLGCKGKRRGLLLYADVPATWEECELRSCRAGSSSTEDDNEMMLRGEGRATGRGWP